MQGKIMSEQSAAQPVYVGVDVCKERLDVYVHPTGQRLSVANSRDGLKRLKQALAGVDVALVVNADIENPSCAASLREPLTLTLSPREREFRW